MLGCHWVKLQPKSIPSVVDKLNLITSLRMITWLYSHFYLISLQHSL